MQQLITTRTAGDVGALLRAYQVLGVLQTGLYSSQDSSCRYVKADWQHLFCAVLPSSAAAGALASRQPPLLHAWPDSAGAFCPVVTQYCRA